MDDDALQKPLNIDDEDIDELGGLDDLDADLTPGMKKKPKEDDEDSFDDLADSEDEPLLEDGFDDLDLL